MSFVPLSRSADERPCCLVGREANGGNTGGRAEPSRYGKGPQSKHRTSVDHDRLKGNAADFRS